MKTIITTPEEELRHEINQAEQKAWESLSKYKFMMFGYWAGIWVHLNRISGEKRPNPFKQLVKGARYRLDSEKATLQAYEGAGK